MQSAFGVDHGEFGKADTRQKNNVKGSAIAGSGGVVAGLGAVAGGVPGAKADSNAFGRSKSPSFVQRQAESAKAIPGGILGFRQHAHGGGIWGFKQKDTENEWGGPPKTRKEAFARGHNHGKIEPEVKVIRGLAQGRKAANAALIGGTAATAYGLHLKHKKPVSKSRRSDSYNATLAGGGATAAGLTHGVPMYLDSKKRKYSAMAADQRKQAGDLAPHSAGKRTGEIMRHPEHLAGTSRKAAQAAGDLHGSAGQYAHFADVLGDTSRIVRRVRNPSLAAAGVGVGGLAYTHRKKS